MATTGSDLWRAFAKFRHLEYSEKVCTELTAEMLQELLGLPEARGDQLWDDLQIMDPARPWSPVEGLGEALGIEPALPHRWPSPETGPPMLEPGRLHLCQGWRNLVGGSEGRVGVGSSGHAFFWLAGDEPMAGIVIESSGVGPRVWDGYGKHAAHEVVSEAGELLRPMRPMRFSVRAKSWTDRDRRGDGVAWLALP